MGMGSQRDARAALPRERSGNHCIGGWVRKISLPPRFDPRTVQPIYCILYPKNPTKLKAMNILDSCILYTSNFTNIGGGNVTSYILGPQDIKLYFGFDPQPAEFDAPAIRIATYHG